MRQFVAGSVLLHAAALGVWQLPQSATPTGAPVLQLTLARPETALPVAGHPAPATTGPVEPQGQSPSPHRREVRPAPAQRRHKTDAAASMRPETATVASKEPVPQPAPAVPHADRHVERLNQLRARLESTLNAHLSYPLLARKRGWQGTVRLALHIDERGRVVKAEVAESSGHRLLDRAALEGLARARLETDDGWLAPGDFDMVVPVTFRLVDG